MILVTGGAGRLGFEVVKKLSAMGEEARVFDLPIVNWASIDNLGGLSTFKGDIAAYDDVARACENVDEVIHLAAIMPPRSETERSLALRVNIEGTRNLIRAAKAGTPFVLASTISVYGITADESQPIHEGHALDAHDTYSETKMRAERLIADSGNPYATLRISPITVADLVELPPIVPYKREQRVEFVFVEDVAAAIVEARKTVDERETFNVAGGRTWQMLGHEYIERFYSALGTEVEPTYSNAFTAVDWYDTSKGRRLAYQRTSFMDFEEKLKAVGETYGLR